MTKSATKRWNIYRPLVGSALIAGSLFQLAMPVFAEGTTAGTSISNTGTATYIDPTNPLTIINATSNQVTVTVAEVAGVTVTASGITDNNGGKISPNDQLYFQYTVTNVGNDPTQFNIPDQVTSTGSATVNGSLQVSYDGGTTWSDVTANFTTNSVAPGQSILVQVPILVDSNASPGANISVKLGNTPNDGQNQPLTADGNDLYTVDNDAVGAAGVPVNGERESSATQQTIVEATAQALATVLKTKASYSNSGTPSDITDDSITYNLGLKVEATDPTGKGINPAPLVGTNITLNGAVTPRILISDAIPIGTELEGTPIAPSGWQVVYSTTPIATAALQAEWTTTKPATGITRVGFINDPSLVTSVAPGQTINGFSLQLGTLATVASPLSVANIAQAFGATQGVPNILVYDESGDQNPNNYNPLDGTVDLFDPLTDNGLLDPTDLINIGIDTNNNNTGSGPGGEATVVEIAVPAVGNILNGPKDIADALGPTNSDDDFTNKSTPITQYTKPGSKIDPAAVDFVNTFINKSGQSADVTLLPTAPANPLDLPDKTVVTITAADILNVTKPIKSATYEYNQASGTFTLTNGTPIVFNNPLPLVGGPGKGVLPNVPIAYNVKVDLPTNTSLSTDTIPDYTGDTEFGFPVPITAYLDTNGDGTFEGQNTTIDRVYTGYLKLVKESRLLQGTGSAIPAGQEVFSDTQKNPAPGNIIEYRITYTNISTPGGGVGNIGLNASTVVITDDGKDTAINNNWALDNDGNDVIDTSHVVGKATDPNGIVTYLNPGGTVLDAVGVDITKYLDTIVNVAPGKSGTFTFQRQVN
ncbi:MULTISPECIES: beta strand repeat-containing protein [unclassified Coleofasciculus]|uniref:beta strand repeat-containing protein n=1 Tax=unclassified Coleofasciculus TaxID=2692782 RepID=UPI0018809528|nr:MULTISPECIES: hypothetical protein [unclassified Coleofasciculus]MBE9126550.1 hypothetical protein [Coleofasciculus sp. LEGE 07081]MBE9149984.1 hypothetical protein [Coleofasciculus sp. LEGE 07092]